MVLFSAGARDFSSLQRPDRVWGLPSRLFNVYGGSFPRDKTTVCQAHPSSAEFHNEWSYICTHPYVFMTYTGLIWLVLYLLLLV